MKVEEQEAKEDFRPFCVKLTIESRKELLSLFARLSLSELQAKAVLSDKNVKFISHNFTHYIPQEFYDLIKRKVNECCN